MTVRSYASAEAFKQALEQRLRESARPGADISRERQLLVFDRFLARTGPALGPDATLKGGLVLELRLGRARTTRDIDLRLLGRADTLLERLQRAGRMQLGDFMTFEVLADARHPEIQGDGVQYQGLRFRAQCRLAGKPYGHPFGVDAAFGDPMLGEPEPLAAPNRLAFAGIEPPQLRVYPVETHVAEKLHAYTLPRTRPNSRIKDLPDIALLAMVKDLTRHDLRRALEQTFRFRATHALPPRLPDPPPAWQAPYAAMSREDDLPFATLAEVTAAARAFLEPVLTGERVERWSAQLRRWLPA